MNKLDKERRHNRLLAITLASYIAERDALQAEVKRLTDAETAKKKVERQRCEHCDSKRYEYDCRKQMYVAVDEKFCPYCGGDV